MNRRERLEEEVLSYEIGIKKALVSERKLFYIFLVSPISLVIAVIVTWIYSDLIAVFTSIGLGSANLFVIWSSIGGRIKNYLIEHFFLTVSINELRFLLNKCKNDDDNGCLEEVEAKVERYLSRGIERTLENYRETEIIEGLQRIFSQYVHPEEKVVNAEAIKRWLCQFETTKRKRLALTLLENVVFINRKKMGEMFQHYYENILPPEEKNKIILTNLGGPYDSSNLVSYFLGDKGMKMGIECADLRSSLDKEKPTEKIILFIDDNIGSGKQAVDTFRDLLGIEEKELKERHGVKLTEKQIENLKKFKLRFFTFVGFEEGKRKFVNELQKLGLNVEEPYSFLKMEEKIGCFHPASPIFDNPQECEAAKFMCREIGYQLFSEKINWSDELRKERSSGYGNSQKLIVFFYNVPTSTLPILWKKGRYNNKKWEPLFLRREKK